MDSIERAFELSERCLNGGKISTTGVILYTRTATSGNGELAILHEACMSIPAFEEQREPIVELIHMVLKTYLGK